LFGSGFCALVYQTAWLRQFRLIFGASTAATAAVLAIFMGGLGIGSALLGRRADAHPRPLAFYGKLELLIAAAAAISPLLLWIAAKIYFATGGSLSLGIFFATIVRLILATLVLGAPTFLMGGTLPAAARAVETSDDTGRRKLAALYAANTLGAVTGTLVSTFFMLERFGNRGALFVAVGVNAIVAIVALAHSRERVDRHSCLSSSTTTETGQTGLSVLHVLFASALVGFAFLLMELVWYRMLAPLLGGTTFTFGLILATALLGIGLGGFAYSFVTRRATAGGFALTCSLEALAIAIPFALGDRLAVLAELSRDLGALGFHGYVISWTLLTIVVVFPGAFVAGVQFPLLIALLGGGDENVGDHVGRAYAWNTAGAIAGSLAGGFGLLPLLTAPGSWRLVIVLLAVLGGAAMLIAVRQYQFGAAFASTLAGLLAIACTFALGPTAVWRHSGIGAGRATKPESLNTARLWMNGVRRSVIWDVDGRESSVALIDAADFAFVVNGKVDGSARGDAGTQVMAGLVGGALHPNPQRALVIGLGTGSTAGWLGAIPSMRKVDVVELEPAVIGVARACASVNHDVLHNPKVAIHIADAREALLTTREHYDIIFSEPSNPYRAGIASLFTEEFYRATAARLERGGIFLQWVQAYDVDAQTIRTIYATIARVFPEVETWETVSGDLLLVATREPIVYDAAALRRRVAQAPFLDAMSHTWRVESLEGFLSHFVARASLARTIARSEQNLNTDDRTLVEFGFARGLGEEGRFDMNELAQFAIARGEDRPRIAQGTVAWNDVVSNRATTPYMSAISQQPGQQDLARHRAAIAYDNGNLAAVLAEWRSHPWPLVNSGELVMLADSLADSGSEAAAAYAEQLWRWEPVDADLVLCRLRFHQQRYDEAAALLHRAFVAARSNPWPTVTLFGRTTDIATQLSKTHKYTPMLIDAFSQPFAAGQWKDVRLWYLALITNDAEGCGPHTIHALRALEPWPPWRRDFLELRRACYASAMAADLFQNAQRDFAEFESAEPFALMK
jgi:spermidine synthase